MAVRQLVLAQMQAEAIRQREAVRPTWPAVFEPSTPSCAVDSFDQDT